MARSKTVLTIVVADQKKTARQFILARRFAWKGLRDQAGNTPIFFNA